MARVRNRGAGGRSGNTVKTCEGRGNLYQEVTDRIVAELEAGRMPWDSSQTALGLPDQKLMERDGSDIVFRTNLLDALERRELQRVGGKLAGELGKPFRADPG